MEFIQNTPIDGLQTDLNPSLSSDKSVTYARNMQMHSREGDVPFYQTEPSTVKIVDLPYKKIGHIKLPDGTICLFLTDDKASEIGIFDEVKKTYTKVLNAQWLNFSTSNLITGASKENSDKTYNIYWSDRRRNPDRILNLSQASKATEDSILSAKLITPPQVSLEKSLGGQLVNGSYSAGIFYSMNGQRFGNFYSQTLQQVVFSDGAPNGALDVKINNVDSDFSEFQLVILQTAKGTTTAKVVGTYPRQTSNIHIQNFERTEYENIPLTELTVENEIYTASDQIASNNQYLFKVGTESVADPNYQLDAFKIIPEYVVWQTPDNYHSYGDKVGYWRDEFYYFFIQLLHKTGKWSSDFFVSGRKAKGDELQLASGSDTYEGKIPSCEEKTVMNFQVKNTASFPARINVERGGICQEWEVGFGELGYHQSTDNYPDSPLYGDNRNTPIRGCRMPDEERVPRYEVVDGVAYVNHIGIRFKNIPHPKKADGTPDLDWVGYRIVRADRNGNRSVISRGILTNVRSYEETMGNEKKEVMFSNYPINDLRPDSFISQKQTTWRNHSEHNYSPLTKYFKDKFNYHSPNNLIGRYSMGPEMKIESEEVADVDGQFTEVYQHPKNKLLSLFSFWIAAAMGSVQALITTLGTSNTHGGSESEIDVSVTGGVKKTSTFTKDYKIETAEDLIGLDLVSMTIDALAALDIGAIWQGVKDLVIIAASLSLKVLSFTFIGIQYANIIIEAIQNFLGYINYTLQYNCHAFFKSQAKVNAGYKRRFVSKYQYLETGLQTIDGKLYNNYGKSPSVFVQLNEDLADFRNQDTSRQTLKEFKIKDLSDKTTSRGVAWYATSKLPISNQYGRLESIHKFILTHNGYYPMNGAGNYKTPVLFGGDCYISRASVLTKHLFFTQNQASLTAKDGEEFDYRLYRNIGYPRFWANFFKYDFSELISKDVTNFSTFSRTVASRHNLDNKGTDDENKFRVDNAYFYISNNGVLDFFCESDFNLYTREKSTNDTFFYSDKFTSLSEIFRNDRLVKEEQYNFDTSLNHQSNEFFGQIQPIDWSPEVNTSYSQNRLNYSLPSYQEQKFDNWQQFLTANTYQFPMSEFGKFTAMHRVDGDRILFLFDRSSPYITLGQNELKTTSDLTITIGDGGLFASPPRELLYTEQHYGNSQSKFAAVSSQYGTFYISERQGRVFNFAGSLDEITREGIYFWTKMYMPIKLTEYFPEFKDVDNTVVGVGYTMALDTTDEILYISKKDYIPKEELLEKITYNVEKNKFYYNGSPIELTNPTYFDNLSFTLSYSPVMKKFVSYHDWIPDSVILSENHFYTIKDKTIWKHNDNSLQEPCKFYGVKFPTEIEYVATTKMKVDILQSIEYYLESYKYVDKKNKVHILNDNFSHIMINNSEQSSGLLELVPEPVNPYERIKYPIPNPLGATILFHKVENKYRVNQFFDLTKDRMNPMHALHYLPNGYQRVINKEAIDPYKDPRQQKSFRHYDTRITLMKDDPLYHMIFKLFLTKETESYR